MTHVSDQRPRRSLGRRLVTYTGVLLLLGGLGILSWVGWQLYGTNWQSRQHQQQLTQQWQAQPAKQLEPKYVPQGKVSALIRIPKFGKGYVVPVLEGTSDAVLARGYGHFTETADPGQQGNYALAAHRITHGEPLRRMPELRPGDKVIVETKTHTYTYELDTDPNQLVIPFTGVWVLDQVPKNPDGGVQPKQLPGQRLITLTTCAELFHTDERMIAFGHLVGSTPKGAQAS